jgi:NADPH:quinone reductase-like Zn-dependent oxidoreductase
VPSLDKVLVVYGGSSSVGSMTIQLATAAGIHVVAIAGAKNFELTKRCGAVEVFDYKDPNLVSKVVDAARDSGHEFIGIVDAISTDETYPNDLAILAELGGKHLVCTHPLPVCVPMTVKAGMVFAVNDAATPVWNDFVTSALQSGKLQCLPPPTIIGKGLEKSKAGVSATKLVVEL